MKELSENDKAQVTGRISQSNLVIFCPGLQGRGSTLRDRSTYANNGVISGPTWSKTSRGAIFLQFNSQSNTLNFPFSGGFSPTTFSILFWLKPGLIDNYTLSICGRQSEQYNWNGFFFQTNNGGGLYCGTDVTSRFTPSDTGNNAVVLNTWSQFAYTYDGAQGRLYKNDSLLVGPRNQNSPLTWSSLIFGRNSAGSQLIGGLAFIVLTTLVLSLSDIIRSYKRNIPLLV